MSNHAYLLPALILFHFLPALHLTSAKTVDWNGAILDSADLEAAIRQAESGPKTIVLKTKTIQLTAALRITTDNIHIISEHATKIACTDENRAFEVEADGVQFKGITFENCPQSVTIETKKPTLTRFDEVNFIDNIAWDDYSYGGGIYLSAAVDRGNTGVLPGAIVQSCNFTGNVAGVGGAIFAENFNLTILDSIFVGNEADAGGGAVAVEGKRAECRVERSQFLQNSVKGTGYDTEVSYIGGAPIEPFRYFRFAFPSATGGALRTRDVGELRIVQCDFDGNTATAGGAMAHEMSFDAYASSKNSVDRRIIIQKSTFTKNEAQAPPEEDASGELGGAIYTISAGNYVKWKAQNCVFEQNSARDGGAVHLVTTVATRPNMEGCTFSENTASRFGGAVLLRNTGSAKLKGCKFQKNVADKAGGGILATNNAFMLVEGLSGLPPEERRGEINTFSENTAQHGGGIACIGCGDLIVRDALFETNTAAEDGGGLYIFDSDSMMQVLQSTFIGNEAGERGGGVAVEAVASVSFTSAAESLKTVFQKNIAVSGSAMFYRAGHQKENRFSLSNAEIAEQQSIENEGLRNGGTLQLELNYLPSKAIADVLLHHVLLNKNKAIFGGGLSIEIKGKWSLEPLLGCPDTYLSRKPCRMLRLVYVNITDNEAETAPGLYVTDGNAVGLTCQLAVNEPVVSLSDQMQTVDDKTHAFDGHCSHFDNNLVSVVHTRFFKPISFAWLQGEDDRNREEKNIDVLKGN